MRTIGWRLGVCPRGWSADGREHGMVLPFTTETTPGARATLPAYARAGGDGADDDSRCDARCDVLRAWLPGCALPHPSLAPFVATGKIAPAGRPRTADVSPR